MSSNSLRGSPCVFDPPFSRSGSFHLVYFNRKQKVKCIKYLLNTFDIIKVMELKVSPNKRAQSLHP